MTHRAPRSDRDARAPRSTGPTQRQPAAAGPTIDRTRRTGAASTTRRYGSMTSRPPRAIRRPGRDARRSHERWPSRPSAFSGDLSQGFRTRQRGPDSERPRATASPTTEPVNGRRRHPLSAVPPDGRSSDDRRRPPTGPAWWRRPSPGQRTGTPPTSSASRNGARADAKKTSARPGRICPSGRPLTLWTSRSAVTFGAEQGRRRLGCRASGRGGRPGRRRTRNGLAACPSSAGARWPDRRRPGNRRAGCLPGRRMGRGHRRTPRGSSNGRWPRTSRGDGRL